MNQSRNYVFYTYDYNYNMCSVCILAGEVKEVCQWETFNATCSPGHVIMITSARYGRMRMGRCVRKSYDTIGCAADIMHYADSQCSGKRSCKFSTAEIAIHGIRPCPEDLTSFLEASYTCLPGDNNYHFFKTFT